MVKLVKWNEDGFVIFLFNHSLMRMHVVKLKLGVTGLLQNFSRLRAIENTNSSRHG